jgi:methyl-accepting chemotaxis protein
MLGIVITVSTSLIISGNVVTEETLAKIERNTSGEAVRMDSWLNFQVANITTLSDALGSMDNVEPSIALPLLKGALERNASYNNVYIGYPDNTAVMADGFPIWELYDVWKATETEWYKLALSDLRRSHITQPYIDTDSGELCITVSHAILNDGMVVGVVGTDILLMEINEFIGDI